MDEDHRICLAALNAYHEIRPDSFFRRKLSEDEMVHAENTLVVLGFLKLKSLAKNNSDFFVILKVIEENVDDVFELIIGEIEVEEFIGRFEHEKKLCGKNARKFTEIFEKEMNSIS